MDANNVDLKEALRLYKQFMKTGSADIYTMFKFHVLNLRMNGLKEEYIYLYSEIEKKQILEDYRYGNLFEVFNG